MDLRVQYSDTAAKFAGQVVVKGTREEVFLEFSEGAFVDSRDGKAVLPVHSRIVMTIQGANRLLQALGKVLADAGRANTASKKGEAGDKGGGIRASLPKI